MDSELRAGEVNWINNSPPVSRGETLKVQAKIRYSSAEAEAEICLSHNREVRVSFLKPQRAITPGQAVVFYQGEEVIGGGTMRITLNPLFAALIILSLFTLSSCVSKNIYQEVQSQLAKAQQEKASLEDKITSLNSDLTNAQTRLTSVTSELETAKAEVSTLKTSLSGEQAKVRTLSSEAENTKNRLSQLETSLKQEKDITNNLRIQLLKTEITILSLEKEKDSLKSSLAALTKAQPAPAPTTVAGITFAIYKDEKNGFSIEYPKDWIKQESIPMYMITFQDNLNVMTSVNVITQTLPIDMSISQYWDINKGSLETFGKYTPLSTVNLSINGIPAIRHIYTIEIPISQTNLPMELSHVALVKDKRAWIITFGTTPDDFKQYSPIFDYMAQSFKLF